MDPIIQHYQIGKDTTSSNIKIYKKGDVIYNEETPSFGLYYISQGTVKVFMTDRNGREVILRLASDGDIFGHGYLFGEKNHTDSAKAMEETHCHFLDGNDFHSHIMKNPSLGVEIMKKIGKELNSAQNRCVDLIKKNVRERLACYFHYMAKNHSEQNDKGTRIKLQLSREEIASIIGTANETAIRFISEFKEMGLIEEEDRYFQILDHDRIASIGRIH
jgi:CRP-like cAMP-binding protein